MSRRGGLPATAVTAITGLALFGVAILLISRASTPADPAPPVISLGDSVYSEWILCEVGFLNHDVTEVVRHNDECLAEGETVMIVDGLPGVSGVYASRQGNVSVEGWSLGPGGDAQTIGRCFVDAENIFRTKVVASATADDGSETDVLITVDVGLTGGGPFAAVVGEVGTLRAAGGQAAATFKVSHNYNPGSGFVAMKGVVWDADNFTGVATFTPTNGAEVYNNRDFSPWTDTQYLGQPNYDDFAIILYCK